MARELENLVSEVRSSIQADPLEGGNSLVMFANAYARSSRLRHMAFILKLNYRKAGSDEDRDKVLSEMLGLVDDIAADFQMDPGGEAAKPLDELVDKAQQRYRDIQQPRGTVFQCQDLGKTFRNSGFNLRDINLELRLGEITGVVGENGNGKTTLFRIVAGELAHDHGSMRFSTLSEDSTGIRGIDWVRVREHVAYVPQALPKWYGTILDNLQFEAAIHGIRGKDNEREVGFVVERLGLSEHLNKKWSEISGGFKLRFYLARALVWKPKLLIIDEPLANLDFKAQQIVLKDLRNLADGLRYPMSVLISSQHLHEVEAIADNILFLENGRVKFSGRTGELGAERDANTFELRTSCPEDQLRDHLTRLGLLQIQHAGIAYVVTLPLQVTQRELLQLLLDQGVDVEYFRDISRSAKQLFH
ncbi:MAG: ABC transporter ATP-binding protein [Gammaproteobacteria bacterium]|nr:ABC transporter ATP-binding protein [Gammaproteobacteria bacterium]